MQPINTLISDSKDNFSNELSYNYDGLVNNRTYLLDLQTESQNENRSIGMIKGLQKTFHVEYEKLILKNKPILTELLDKSAIQIDWASLYQNQGILNGIYDYIDNFILKNNTALSLGDTGVLQYNSTISTGFTMQFMIKISNDYNGVIFTTLDGKYQIGYDNDKYKFYTIINGITNYSQLIKITECPFYITATYNHIIIRQYNVYYKLDTLKQFKLDDIQDLPLDFIVQANN
jgi:hypothetical protein